MLDVLDARIPAGQLLAVRKRLPYGTHLPHPAIKLQRVRAAQMHFDRPVTVYLDGERVGAFRDASVRVEPDALTVVV